MASVWSRLSIMTVDADRTPRAVWVRGQDGDFEWTLSPSRDDHGFWTLELSAPDRVWTGTGHNCFAALRDLRLTLDSAGYPIGVNGARAKAAVSGMQADMGEGRVMYLLVMGESGRPEQVPTLDPAPLDQVASVDEQDRTNDAWYSSRRTCQ
jgi:hypothetical protein